jgi:predicted transcriptional regulator
MHDIKSIGKMRKQAGLTQKQLADISGVSQSLIAKIESGNIDPAYSKASQILYTLANIKKKEREKAGDIMTSKIISVRISDTLDKAAAIMKKHGISQLPVIDSGKSVGSISDSMILDAISGKASLGMVTVGEIMGESFPVISRQSVADVCADLLRYYPAVMVEEKGILKGIITKADLLRVV